MLWINKDSLLWMMDQKAVIIHQIKKKELKKLKLKKKKLLPKKKRKLKKRSQKVNEVEFQMKRASEKLTYVIVLIVLSNNRKKELLSALKYSITFI